VALGPDRAKEALRSALAMGCDRAIHVNDPALAAADTLTTARVLAGVEAGTEEILADERARSVHADLLKDRSAFDAAMQRTWDQRPRS